VAPRARPPGRRPLRHHPEPGRGRGGKKGRAEAEADYLDGARADFPGYRAAAELYDGPGCILAAVAARRQRRLLDAALDHDPTPVDILYFRARLHDPSKARGQAVAVRTTAASSLDPVPLALARGDVPLRPVSSLSSRG